MLDRGDRVVATVRRPDALADLQSEYGDALQVEVLDLRDIPAIDGVVERVTAQGPLDVVVNNAGYSVVGSLEELTVDQIHDQLMTMLYAPILITRAFLPALRENGGGHILQISSRGGQVAFPAASIYHASKWGLEGVTESVAQEVAPFGIHCTIIEPAAVRTSLTRSIEFARELPPYATGPVAGMRDFFRDGDRNFTGDAAKVAAVVVEVSMMADPPLRLALGEQAYEALDTAFESRRQSLREFEKVSRSMDLDAIA